MTVSAQPRTVVCANLLPSSHPRLGEHRGKADRMNRRDGKWGREPQNAVFRMWRDRYTHKHTADIFVYIRLVQIKWSKSQYEWRRRFQDPTSFRGALGSWQLVEEGKPLFFGSMVAGRMPMNPWWFYTHACVVRTNWTQGVSINSNNNRYEAPGRAGGRTEGWVRLKYVVYMYENFKE